MGERLFLRLEDDPLHGPESAMPAGTLRAFPVSATLRGHVSHLMLYRETFADGHEMRERVLPDGAVRLVFNFGDAPSAGGGDGLAVGAIGMSLGYLVTSATVLKFRRAEPDRARPYKMPMGNVVALVATLGSTALILAALRDPWVSSGGKVPLEWMLMAAWAVVGFIFYSRRAKA